MPFLTVKSKFSCFSLTPNYLTANGHLSIHVALRLSTTAGQYSVSLLPQAFTSLSIQMRSRSLPNMFLLLGFDACREDWVEHFVYGVSQSISPSSIGIKCRAKKRWWCLSIQPFNAWAPDETKPFILPLMHHQYCCSYSVGLKTSLTHGGRASLC